jgi:PAS domain S-box-containing protein
MTITKCGTPSRLPVQLSAEEDNLVTSLKRMGGAVVLTRANLDLPGPTIIGVNPGYEAITGYTGDEVLGWSPRITQGPLTERRVLDQVRECCQRGRRFEGETVNYRKNGEAFLLHWCINPLRDAAGEITHFLAVQEDVTEQRRYAADWIRAEHAARSALNDRSEHVAAIAEAILVLERTKQHFRSRELAQLRRKLEDVLARPAREESVPASRAAPARLVQPLSARARCTRGA